MTVTEADALQLGVMRSQAARSPEVIVESGTSPLPPGALWVSSAGDPRDPQGPRRCPQHPCVWLPLCCQSPTV